MSIVASRSNGALPRVVLLLVVTAVAALVLVTSVLAKASGVTASQITVARGEPVQIAAPLDHTGPIGAGFTEGIRNAIQMAVGARPVIRGHRVQVNDFDAPCGTFADVGSTDVAVAKSVVDNPQNVGVIGQMCSESFGGPNCATPLVTPLSIYEEAEIVTINGSATADCLPQVGPTVFNRTIVADAAFDAWYAAVQALPSDIEWAKAYALRFGKAPTPLADLYYDAAGLLLKQLQRSSDVTGGNLTIDRAALARAVRTTTRYEGITCTVTLDPATGNRVDDPAALSACAAGAADD
jgi:ABC-type branched-subunit amino acid transport system substrate-binding protein